MKSFTILIENDDHAELFEQSMNEHNIKFQCEIIYNKTELIYEYQVDLIYQKNVLSIIKNNDIEVLEFISN
jgi:hypothetical protein